MRQDIIDTLNDPTLIQAREYQMDRLTRLFSGEEEGPFRIAGCRSGSPKDPFLDPEGWAEDCLTGLALQADQLLDKEVFHPLCAEYWFYGVHFTDRVFGAPVQAKDDLFWTPGVENEIGELPVPDLERNETWKVAQRLTEALVSFGAKAPFIATQVLGEPWNQTFNLYRERGLIGFFDDPEGMKRDLGVVTDTLVEMHKWFIGHIPPISSNPFVPPDAVSHEASVKCAVALPI